MGALAVVAGVLLLVACDDQPSGLPFEVVGVEPPDLSGERSERARVLATSPPEHGEAGTARVSLVVSPMEAEDPFGRIRAIWQEDDVLYVDIPWLGDAEPAIGPAVLVLDVRDVDVQQLARAQRLPELPGIPEDQVPNTSERPASPLSSRPGA